MGRDKAALTYAGKVQTKRLFELLSKYCEHVYISNRSNQSELTGHKDLPQLHDVHDDIGPAGGILTAFDIFPRNTWLVVACDLPHLDAATIAYLITHHKQKNIVTAFRSVYDGKPEPLCAIYEPTARDMINDFLQKGIRCPRNMLIQAQIPLLTPISAKALDNINHPEEYHEATKTFELTNPC